MEFGVCVSLRTFFLQVDYGGGVKACCVPQCLEMFSCMYEILYYFKRNYCFTKLTSPGYCSSISTELELFTPPLFLSMIGCYCIILLCRILNLILPIIFLSVFGKSYNTATVSDCITIHLSWT